MRSLHAHGHVGTRNLEVGAVAKASVGSNPAPRADIGAPVVDAAPAVPMSGSQRSRKLEHEERLRAGISKGVDTMLAAMNTPQARQAAKDAFHADPSEIAERSTVVVGKPAGEVRGGS